MILIADLLASRDLNPLRPELRSEGLTPSLSNGILSESPG